MSVPHSDVLVFFGATGDLVYKKIFTSLYVMERRGHLQVPVIRNRVLPPRRSEHDHALRDRGRESAPRESGRRWC